MKTLTYKLTLLVEFDPQGTHPDDLKRNLHLVVCDATNNGTLTRKTPATVERYDCLIEQLPRFATLKKA